MKNLNDIFNIKTSENLNSQLEQTIESLKDGDSGPAYSHLIDLIHDELSQIPIPKNDSHTLYRFAKLVKLNRGTNIESKPIINDIKTSSLTFGDPTNFNDPMDPILKEWINIRVKESYDKIDTKLFKYLSKCIPNIKICCLSKNHIFEKDVYLNPLMWSHYANSHRGICIQYEITKETIDRYSDENQVLRIGSVRYRNHKAMSDYITLDNALLAKGDCWGYENEERLIYYCKKDIRKIREESRKNNGYISLDGFNIKAIYLGYRISDIDKKDIVNATKGKNIEIFQMVFDENDITKLKAIKVN